MANLELNHVYKIYPNGVKAVNDFTMDINDKEFIVFVGPSGCGKSTTLRMIAGLEEITSGEIKIDDRIVNDAEPKERDIAMVFQNYALYPHMTVYKNMAFGLKLRHMPKDEIDKRVRAAAEILGITEYLDRKPKAMSGGQRQRVALGRAIVREPKVFLLDEPLSNLDAKLRAQMRSEISKLHNRLQTTFIYVTHDQVEAMTMGTRIVVMKEGFVQQIDTPRNLYRYPVNKFVAGFIGTPQMNFLKVRLIRKEKIVTIKFEDVDLSLDAPKDLFSRVDPSYLTGDKLVFLGLRSEHISSDPNKYPFVIKCKVSHNEDLGVDSQVYADINVESNSIVSDSPTRIIFKAPTGYSHPTDDVVEVSLGLEFMHLFDAASEESISPLLPSMIKTTGTIKKGVLSIYNGKITLPVVLSNMPDGEYNLEIPSHAVSLGKTVKTELSAINYTTEKSIFTLSVGDEYLFIADKLDSEYKIGDKIGLDFDVKKFRFYNDTTDVEPLCLINKTHGIVTRHNVIIDHVDYKGRNKKITETYCEVTVKEIPFNTNAEIGLKLINLKENKAFKDEVDIEVSPYNVSFGENGISCTITDVLNYGNEKFNECELDDGTKFIVYNENPLQIGDKSFLLIDINKVHLYNPKNQIRLL